MKDAVLTSLIEEVNDINEILKQGYAGAGIV